MGFFESVSRIGSSTGRPDRLCEELGWSIDERRGNTIGLYFKGDHISPRRIVIVSGDRDAEIMAFSAPCRAAFRSIPNDLTGALLCRNKEVTLGAWAADIDGGEISFKLEYTALAAAVDAARFKMICSVLVQEVAYVEGYLNNKGLL